MVSNSTKLIALYVLLTFTGVHAYAQPDLTITAGVNEVFDDNITYVHVSEKEDFVTSLFLSGLYTIETKNQLLEVGGRIMQHIFAKNSEFNNNAQYLNLDYGWDISKYVRLDVKDVFSHSEEPRSFEDAFGRTTGRYSYYRNDFDADITVDVSKQVQMAAGYTYQINEVDREEITDSMLHRFRYVLNYYYSSSLQMGPYYEFSLRTFDPGDEIKKHRVGGQVRKYFTPHFYGDGGAGIDIINTTNKDRVRPFGYLAITDEIDENTAITAAVRKEYITQTYTEDLFDNLRFSLTGKRQLLERLNGSVTGFVGFGEYISVDQRERLFGGDIRLTYDIAKRIKGVLAYSLSVLDSNISTNEYTKNVITLGVTAEWG